MQFTRTYPPLMRGPSFSLAKGRPGSQSFLPVGIGRVIGGFAPLS